MHAHARTVYRIKSEDADEQMICCHGIKTGKIWRALQKVTQPVISQLRSFIPMPYARENEKTFTGSKCTIPCNFQIEN